MYSLTLEINQKCNLSCIYCYLGEKDKSEMPLETATKSIDLAFNNTKIHRDKKIWIDFIGGEPLLDFGYIKALVDYIGKLNKEYNYNLIFSMTTNGTIMNDEILDWIIKNDFLLKVSIDGKKEINDLNRIAKNGESVFEQIQKNWHYFKEYENQSNKKVQVTNVITKNNYMHYFETFRFLINEMKICVIDTAIDLYTNWTLEEWEVIEQEIRKSFSYYIEILSKNPGLYWSFIRTVLECKTDKKKFYSCGAGLVSLYVRTTGEFYTCPTCLDGRACIGNICDEFNAEKVNLLKNFNGIDNNKCQKCDFYKSCKANGCAMFSIFSNNDINRPNRTLCWLEIFKHKLYDENQKVIGMIQGY